MRPIETFNVTPSLPPPLERLRDLAYNLFWSWDHDTRDLFRRLDRRLWEQVRHNPVLMLGEIDQEALAAAAGDVGFISHYDRVCRKWDGYMGEQATWYRSARGEGHSDCIAYFSAEFGLTDCLPNFSGGLGILAGDHLKSASELGLPLVGLGLLYQQGYFGQYLNRDGWQQESYISNDFHNLPVQGVRDRQGRWLTVEVEFPGRRIAVQIWRAEIGRIPLYLLDTNIEANRPGDRDITDALYGGGVEMRIQQEMVLGIGGIRALSALGLRPTVCHMNEGHSAFLALERIRRLMTENGLSFVEAREVASAGHVFTTHTPVPAGNDFFPPELVDKYLGEIYRSMRLSRKAFLSLGRQRPEDDGEAFCMTVLALKLSAHRNAVSRVHEGVSKRLWSGLWPGVPPDEFPISHVNNGIHIRSWISKDMDALFERYMGARWLEKPADTTVWKGIDEIPSVELWQTYERRRDRLVAFARRKLRAQLQSKGATETDLRWADEALDPRALTIGFARRFAAYKRATLLLRDPGRLARLLNDPERPVQIIYAGKAHPRDDAGKELIRQIIHLSGQEALHQRIVFIENYDMEVARYMVQGVDVWLNTPRRGLEASGTSGMKAAANGVLNVSILDGWWDEAYRPEIGWAIGLGEEYTQLDYQDEVESNALYDLLEKEIVPAFYDRGRDGLPRRWVDRMKKAMTALCPVFNTNRMVREYAERFYLPAVDRFERLIASDFAKAKRLAAWKERLQAHWKEVQISRVEASDLGKLKVGDPIGIRTWILTGALKAEDLTVELSLGRVDSDGRLVDPRIVPLQWVETTKGEEALFEASGILCKKSGLHGYAIRVVPRHEDLIQPWDLGLIRWAEARSKEGEIVYG